MHSYSYLLSIPIDLIEARIEVYPAPREALECAKIRYSRTQSLTPIKNHYI